MKRKRFLAFGVLLVSAVAVAAAKYPTSDFFSVDGPKPLAGTLLDQQGAVVANTPFQLLNEHSKVLQTVVMNPYNGNYDFGILQPGRYRIRIKIKLDKYGSGWCKPIVECSASACQIKPLRACTSGY